MKKILIDARLFGPNATGIGIVCFNFLKYFENKEGHKIYVITYSENANTIKSLNSSFEIIETNIKHYSFKEQLLLRKLIKTNGIDLFFSPHFVSAIFTKIPCVITVHDLIKHNWNGSIKRSEFFLIRWIKFLGYKFVFKQSVDKAMLIFVNLNFMKLALEQKFIHSRGKIKVINLGVDDDLDFEEILLPSNYFLYVGNSYSYKNVAVLVDALLGMSDKIHLVLVTKDLSKEILVKIKKHKLENRILILHDLSKNQLNFTYANAIALINPSYEEGFSLTPLEALILKTPIILSRIPAHQELYKDIALFFNPKKPIEIIKCMNNLIANPEIKQEIINKGKKLVNSLTWQKYAKKVEENLNEILSKHSM